MSFDKSEQLLEEEHNQLLNVIKDNRNDVYRKVEKDCKYTLVFSHIMFPMTRHGTHLIYAPSDVFLDVISGVSSGGSNVCKSIGTLLKGKVGRAMKNQSTWMFAGIVALCVLVFYQNSKALTCLIQSWFMGWAMANQGLGIVGRFFSISAMMSLRLMISNLLPFTSPAFAYLIARSQPGGEEWTGAFFLLLCSMPAGAIVPFLDLVLYFTVGRESPEKITVVSDDISHRDSYDDHFLATRGLSFITDYLPFSFWVRSYFMEPAFRASQEAGASPEGAASAAVLAGHFMIWAGAPTTMYQRMFVPDWWTCIFIQPLGLVEDVAVVLATWAGQSPTDQQYAEISLYAFMLLCNLAHWYTTVGAHEPESVEVYKALTLEHCVVAGFTVFACLLRFMDFSPIRSSMSFPTIPGQTITKKTGDVCPTEHTNVSAMLMTVAWVSTLAVVFKVLATKLRKQMYPDAGKAIEGWSAGRISYSNIPSREGIEDLIGIPYSDLPALQASIGQPLLNDR